MEAAEVQRWDDIGSLERSGTTKKVKEEELRLMNQARV